MNAIPAYVEFVRRRTGAINSDEIFDVYAGTATAIGKSIAAIKPHLYEYLAQVDLGPGVDPTIFATGVIIAGQHLPAGPDGVSTVPKVSDISNFLKNKTALQSYLDIINAAHKLVKEIKNKVLTTPTDDVAIYKALGEMHVRLIAHNTKDKGSFLGVYDSQASIAYAFHEAIGAALKIPDDIEIPSILKKRIAKAKPKDAPASVSAAAENVVSVDVWFSKRNIIVGKYYKDTTSKHETAYLLKRIDPSGKVLTLDGEPKPIKVDKDTFLSNYKPTVQLKRKAADYDYTVNDADLAKIVETVYTSFCRIHYAEAAHNMNTCINVVESPEAARKVTAAKDLPSGTLIIPVGVAGGYTIMLVKPSEVVHNISRRMTLGTIDVNGTDWTVVFGACEKTHKVREDDGAPVFQCVKNAHSGNAKLEYVTYEQRSSHSALNGKYLVPHLITTKAVKMGDDIVLTKAVVTKKLRTKL